MQDETPHPPQTAEFGFVTPGGPTHHYEPTDTLRVSKLSFGPYDNNVYVIECARTHETLLIDASAPAERLQKELQELKVAGIVITHDHPDHVVELDEWRDAFGGPVYTHPSDHWFGKVTPVSDGEALSLGDLSIDVLHTPGHTPGSICLVVNGFLFSGDTLFPGGPGGTDGDARRFEQVMTSLDRLFELPDATRVCPGHGLDTTIGRERPYLETWRSRGW
jgi:glyoxylase-like metal-dependent hydrolase (beta-lactamase superfamily II)